MKAARQSISDDDGASGECDLPMRCYYDTTNAKPAVSFDANNPGTAAASPAVGVTESAKHAADVTLPAAAEANTAGVEGGVRLSQDYIDYVLSWKPEVLEDPDELYARMINNPAFTLDDVERNTKLQRELVEQSKDTAASVEGFHAWVRSEFEAKGYVEVNEDYIMKLVQLRQAMEEDELYALAFGPMEGLVVEGDDEDVAPSD